MASGIRIPFVADVRDWLRGTRSIRDDLGDVERDLEGLAREADDAADDIERDFENAGRDIEDVFRDIERDAERAFDDIERKADQTDIGDQLSKSTRRAKMAEVGAELGDELSENLGEGFRSGNFAATIFESLTSLAPALGVAGIAIGGIAGVAGGIARGLDESKQAIQDAASTLFAGITGDAELTGKQAAEAFRRGYLDESSIDEGLEELFGSIEEGWKRVQERTIETGVEADVVAKAYLGNAAALAEVEAAIAANESAYADILTEQGEVFETDRARWQELETAKEVLDEQKRALEDITNKGIPLKRQNEENLRLYGTRRDVLKEIGRQKPPDFGGLVRQLNDIKSDAERAKWALDNMPTRKTVTVDLKQTRGSGGRPILDDPGSG